MNEHYEQVIVELPTTKNIMINGFDFSDLYSYPNLDTGFTHWYHANRNKLREQTDKFKNKKKVYLVINKFDSIIDNYDDDLTNIVKKKFKLNNFDIIHPNFFKMWEIIKTFDLIKKTKTFVSLHISDKYCSYAQAIMLYRNTLIKTNNDESYIINVNSEKFNQEELKKRYKNKFTIFTSYPKKKYLADFVSVGLYFKWQNDVTQEQEAYLKLIENLMVGLISLKKGGNMIVQIYEIFTKPTLEILFVLSSLFGKLYIIKPLICNNIFPEKYIVCINYNNSNLITDKLNELAQNIKNNKILHNILLSSEITEEFKNNIINLNKNIIVDGLIDITNVIHFINEQNFYGDLYHQYRYEQIKATNFWINKFLD